jgi:hypothetical protein
MLRAFVIASAVAILLLGSSLPARALDSGSKPSIYARVVDLLIVRPFGLVPIAYSAAMLPFAYPMAWLGDVDVDPFEICIQEPVAYTFQRPLGEF